ncbi:MAG: hypothetical protein JKY31_12025, partial [Rhodobacteraceae bacterium]|nr:hypothetical protein [Paracoccaceae bacterium]
LVLRLNQLLAQIGETWPGIWRRRITKRPKTQTPMLATIIITVVILVLALFFPISGLAGATTQLILMVFSMVNLTLIVLKFRKTPAPAGTYTVRIWVPIGGLLTCLLMLIGPYLLA